MPARTTGKAQKFARPFDGPYRVLAVHENGIEAYPVDCPHAQPIRVTLNSAL